MDDLDYIREIFPVIWTIEKTGVSPDNSTCRQLLILDLDEERDLGTDPTVEVLQHRVWDQRVELEVRTSSRCFARLAYAYFPYLRVLVDGVEKRPMHTAGRFIALQLEEGEHRIELVPYLSPLRRILLLLDLVLLVVALIVWRRESAISLRSDGRCSSATGSSSSSP